jgi:hypothetical protein
VEELLRDAMQRLSADGREVRLMDIAAGHGRYVIDAVASSPVPVARCCCATTATSMCATARR